MTTDFDPTFGGRLRIPLIIAPMFIVSNPEMAIAACSRGVMGTFPAHSTRTPEILEEWLTTMHRELDKLENPAPWGVNLVVHPTNARMETDLELCVKHRVPVILTSKGAPNDVFGKIHEYGGTILHDVASARHAEKAAEAGADGLIAVTQGAGGHTGTINPFALVNEIRQVTDKPLVLSGCMSEGKDILAAEMLGADLVYMGTRFLAARENNAGDDYRELVVNCGAKDIFYSAALDGAPANWITPSLLECGVDLNELATTIPGEIVASGKVAKRYSKVRSAGQGVGAITKIQPTAEICDEIIAEYDQAVLSARSKLAAIS